MPCGWYFISDGFAVTLHPDTFSHFTNCEPNKADSTRNILVRPQAIKPKEALSYSVESSGTNSAVPQPVWKAAAVLPVFVSILPSLFPGSVRIACRPVQSARRTSFLGEPSICGRRRVPDRLPCVLESLSRRPMLSSCTCFP